MKHIDNVAELIEEAEKIGFKSLSVVTDDNLVLVAGSGAKNPWEKNREEVIQFLNESTEQYKILVRKHARTAPLEWTFKKTKETTVKNFEPMQHNTIPVSDYTKLYEEKSKMETRALIAESKVSSLEARILELTKTDSLEDNEDEEEELSLQERAVKIYEDNAQTIQPIFSTLAETFVGFLNGSSKDDSFANILKLTKKKLSGQELSQFEIGLLQNYGSKMGPQTIEVLSDIFEG